MSVDYTQSEQDRERIIRERQKATAAAFERMRAKIDDQISEMNMSTVSERVRRQQLEEIRNELQKQLGVYYSNLEDSLKSDMISIGQSVLSDSEAFYKSLDMPISMSITSFPVEIMESIINGSVYNEKWFLSNALWGDYQDKLGDINEIVMQGIGMNLPSLEIAKQLEQFVDPSAMKPSAAIVTPCLKDPETGKLYSMDYVKRHPEKDWSGFKEAKSRFYYGKVDYNAQRLARTLVSHAYQQNVVRQAQANPFASGVKWIASGGERMCEICEERDGKIFPVDDVPLDHPNGMCTFSVETPSMMEMSNTLADWVNGDPTDWDDQLNAYYEGRPIEHKSTANASGKAVSTLFDFGKMDKEIAKEHERAIRSISEEYPLKNITLESITDFRTAWGEKGNIDLDDFIDKHPEWQGVGAIFYPNSTQYPGGKLLSGAHIVTYDSEQATFISMKEYLSQLADLRDRNGWHDKSNSFFNATGGIESTMVHEYGHALAVDRGLYYGGDRYNELKAIFDKYSEEDIGRYISLYATTNPQEMFAEAFVLSHESRLRNELIDEIMGLL